jgi:aminotransferase
MHIAGRIQQLTPAMIDVIKNYTADLCHASVPVINLGQAIPNFPPSPAALEAARQALAEPDTHSYSPDAGLLSLRRALCAALARGNGIAADPEGEVLITAGANQAFLTALLTLLEPGDRVLLPGPYFFNHEMAVRIAGGVPVEVPLAEETGFQLRLQDVEPYLEGARALIVCSPNNPSGAVYDPVELARIAHELTGRGIALLTDQTYQHYCYGEARHFSPAALPAAREQVITIGSFSKSYSLTGWRVGYLVAPAAFVEQALKVQDTMVICAPVIAQKTALGALGEPPTFIAARREALDHRRQLLAARLAAIPALHWQPTEGAYFAFVRVAGCRDSLQLTLQVLEQAHVVTIPGSLFGPSGEGYLRLSYGSVEEEELEEACGRLARFFDRTM